MLAVIVLILIISFLVLIHEFGHFYSAKKMGVRVEEFGIGLPPRLFGKKFGETIYSVNLLPFGGFVKITGEDSTEVESSDPKNFNSKTVLQRIVILLAGVIMNFMLAIALYYVLLFANGSKTMTMPLFFDYRFPFGSQENINTVVTFVQEGSGAASSGIEPGEAVLEINGIPVYSVSDVRKELSDKAGQQVKVLLMDVRSLDKDLMTVNVIPQADESGDGILGVQLTKATTLSYTGRYTKPLAGVLHSLNVIAYSGSTLADLVSLSYESRSVEPVSSSVSGPVGIFPVVGGILAYKGKEAVIGIIDLIALLSVNLAFINLLPFPALDGGRALFVIIEKVRGKRVNPAFEMALHKWGMVFLLALIIVLTFKDIANLL